MRRRWHDDGAAAIVIRDARLSTRIESPSETATEGIDGVASPGAGGHEDDVLQGESLGRQACAGVSLIVS